MKTLIYHIGLFLGVSILSLVEIIYYMTLRLVFKINDQQKQNKVHVRDEELNRVVIYPSPNAHKLSQQGLKIFDVNY